MYLYIDTTLRDSFTLALLGDDFVIRKNTVSSRRRHSEKLLPSIEKMLLLEGKTVEDIKGVVAVKGPGSFTSLRIGISAANALAYAVGAPITGIYKMEDWFDVITAAKDNFKKPGQSFKVVIPEYGRGPDITISI